MSIKKLIFILTATLINCNTSFSALSKIEVRALDHESLIVALQNNSADPSYLTRTQVRSLSRETLAIAITKGGIPFQYLTKVQVREHLNRDQIAASIGDPKFPRSYLAKVQVRELSQESLALGLEKGGIPLQYLDKKQIRGINSSAALEEALKSSEFRADFLTAEQIRDLSSEQIKAAHTNHSYLFVLNLIELLSAGNPESVKVRIEHIAPDEMKAKLLSYLDFFTSNLKAEDRRTEKKFNLFLRVIQEALPELDIFTYFHDLGRKNIPNLKAIQVILNHLVRTNPALEYFNEISVVDYSGLTNSFNELEESGKNGKFAFLIKHPNSAHITPVLVSKSSTKVTVIAPDSGGWWDTRRNRLRAWIPNVYRAVRASTLKNYTVLGFRHARQTDGFSCPTISLLDVLEGAKFDMFQYVDNLQVSSPQLIERADMSKWGKLYLINHFHPQMMKVAQSLSAINQFLSQNPQFEHVIVDAEAHKTLRQVTEDSTEKGWVKIGGTDTLKNINFYTRKNAFLFMDLVIRDLLNSGNGN